MVIFTGFQQTAMATSDTGAAQQEQTTESQSEAGKININTANEEELTKLPRIGPVMAKRIVEFRSEHGGFKKAEELMNVKGIGEKTFDKLSSLITI